MKNYSNTDCNKDYVCEKGYKESIYPRAKSNGNGKWSSPTNAFEEGMRVKNIHTKECGVVKETTFRYVKVRIEYIETEEGPVEAKERNVCGFVPKDLYIIYGKEKLQEKL